MGVTRHLRDTKPFNLLPEEVFDSLRDAAQEKRFPENFHIFNQHDPPTGYLYVIKQGEVEIVALTPGGVEMVVDVRGEGDLFGGTPVFTNHPYTAGARTVDATVCYLVPRETLVEIADTYPQVRDHFTREVLSRVRNLYAEMVGEHSRQDVVRMEAYPFKKSLAEIMSTPVETCAPQTSVREVARRMTLGHFGSMVVCDDQEHVVGIITERDLVTKLLVSDALDSSIASASDVMAPSPLSMPPDAFMYEAITYVMTHGLKYLPIIEDGKLKGIVSLQDLMRFRSQKSMMLMATIERATSIDALTSAKGEIVKVASALMGEARSHFESMEIISYLHHSILRRGYEIILAEIEQEGQKIPDVRFCMMIMGSGGRREMLLNPDQDNGIIYEDLPEEKLTEVEAFFKPFSERLVAAYDEIGYPLCNGEVMVNNPLWRGCLSDWAARVAKWVNVPEPQNVMNSTIFLDFMPLVGDPTLCQDLREIVHEEVRRNPRYLYHLLENDLNLKAPIGVFERFVVDKSGEHKGKISIKQAGSIFIVDCIRIFLLEKGVDATTTIERLEKLVELNVFTEETSEHIRAALEAFTFLRLRREIELVQEGKEPSHYVDPARLSKVEQDLLREAFQVAMKVQDSAKRHFGGGAV